MKILHNARTAKNWKHVCDCKDCGSKLKVNARDLTFVADSASPCIGTAARCLRVR